MANENHDFYDQANWEKPKERKENPNSNIPMMEIKVMHPMRMAKEKADMTKENPKREHPATQQVAELQEPAYAEWTNQAWD